MKYFLLPVILFFIAASGQAQKYSITPGPVLHGNAGFNDLAVFDIYQENISGETIYLEWELLSNNLVPGWDFSLCDYGACYGGIPANGSMDPVPASEKGFLGLNIDPYTISGTGSIKMYVYEKSAPLNGDTLTWIITAGATGITISDVSLISLYPNPATDFLSIDFSKFPGKLSSIALMNLTGQTIIEKTLSNEVEQLDIRDLPKGTYLVRVQDNQKTSLVYKFIK